jgi:hypothetical protein
MTCTRVLQPSVPDGFEWALPVDSDDFEVFWKLTERTSGDPWEPIHMNLLKVDDRNRPQRHAYLPWMQSGVLVLRDEAIEVVGSLLQPHGELLPLTCDDARLALFSAPIVAGVLDEDRSDIVRFSSGHIMDLRAPVLRTERLGGHQAFKLAEMPRGKLYLCEQLVEEVRATGMTSGTGFSLVYEEKTE